MLTATREGLRIIAPLAGVGLYAWLGGGSVAVLDAATFVGSALFIARMHLREEKPLPSEHHFKQDVLAGFRHIRETPTLRHVLVGLTVAMLVIGFSETLIFFVIQAIHQPPTFFAYFGTIQGVGSIIGGVTAASAIRRLPASASFGTQRPDSRDRPASAARRERENGRRKLLSVRGVRR